MVRTLTFTDTPSQVQCPVCKAKLKRLANHLTQSHPQLSTAQRDRALKEAVVVKEGGRKVARVEKGQLSLKEFTVQTDKPSKPDYSTLLEAKQKTLNFPSFPQAHLQELFSSGREGEERSGSAGDLCGRVQMPALPQRQFLVGQAFGHVHHQEVSRTLQRSRCGS